ncbi:sulfatase [Novipirellula rosea]|uniref:sulfatase family protein n=1 Tax=Novipirellula rosea TaxID=1031540 RepID=UPI0031EB0B40
MRLSAKIFPVVLLLSATITSTAPAADTRPNILWITIEDWSPDLSCYGTKGIHTPNVDKLAAEGIRYERAFTTSPVCSTSRSAMMTGFHQNYIGAHQHRTEDKKPLPYGIRPIPHLLADAGYYTVLMSWKTDCNFLPDTRQELFMDLKDWKNRKPDQPFFARITFGGTHRSWNRDPERPIDIEDVELPPYYPDTPFIRRDWANGLEQMQLVDREVGAILKRLVDEGLADNTIVFFIGDHGRCHIRGKQFLYDEGTRIPMIMRWPGHVEPAQVNDDLVMSIDICATVLEAAGVTPSVPLHGKSLLSDEVNKRRYTFAARDKMDTTHDAMRSIRSKDFKLILNLMPERAYCQFSFYKEGAYPPLAELNILNLEGKLTPEQAAFLSPSKPPVELFDLRGDPHEVHNIADDPKYAEVKSELLAELNRWRDEVIRDQGVSDDFRAQNVFPPERPAEQTVGQWVQDHADKYDFKKHGVPSWYPTRTLQQWREVRKIWEPWVFRDVDSEMKRPVIPFTEKPKASAKK